jgi:polyribonucleotide nucleotidyltransferase
VGETGRIGGVGRREIGHGMLAERALKPVMPGDASFPYTVRIVSEIMESNGSSSMASVCGGCLSLMDAGVPITDVVAGIAMGLVMDPDGKSYQILTDIQGVEDHLGDMDFKVAGTEKGVTAFQMDIKVQGITFEIFAKALEQAHKARLDILRQMKGVIDKPRAEISRFAPRIMSIKIDPEKIGAVIGKGGETIRSIQDETGAKIEIDDDGTVCVSAVDVAAVEKAIGIIQGITAEVEVGEVYRGKVRKVTDFGAFIEILPGKDGLCHISKLSEERVGKVSDICREGDYMNVRVADVDKLGRINLSAIGVKQEKG